MTSEGRWLVKAYCGCRVPNPAKSRGVLPTLAIRHCELHAGAHEMLYLLAEIYFTDSRWHDKIDSLEREFLSRAWRDMRRQFEDMLGKGARATLPYYVDSETAILHGRRNVDRTKVTCRLCDTTVEDDDLARVLHLRSAHRKEWRKVSQ